MPFPPRGLKAEENPLKHRFDYSFALNASADTLNSCWVTLVRSDKLSTTANAKSILVNPHNTDVDVETGPLCHEMSILQRMKIIINMSHTPTDLNFPFKLSITPFFCSFGEKYDAKDDDTALTVASIMQLTKDDTNEDIVPLTTNNLTVVGNSKKDHPLSTVNLAEVATTHYNMTGDAIMEDTPFANEAFQRLITMGTNKGALKSCLGRTRHYMFDKTHFTHSLFLDKFLPRPIRRIVPFTFFGLLFHMPIETDPEAFYQAVAVSTTLGHIGIKVMIRYDEWNELHDNDKD